MRFAAALALFPMAAFAVTVEPLPQSEFADTEVSTNMAFVVERPAMTRIEFTVALDATPTNNVEVAIGADANGDGNLAVEEASYVFGYDCGRWFCRDRDANKTEEAIANPVVGAFPRNAQARERANPLHSAHFTEMRPPGIEVLQLPLKVPLSTSTSNLNLASHTFSSLGDASWTLRGTW